MSDVDIVAQLRAWRDEFARSHGYDIHAMAAAVRAFDCGQRKIVHGEPRRPVVTKMPNQPLPTEAAASVSEGPKVAEAAPAGEL
jgi:hypothetical protein